MAQLVNHYNCNIYIYIQQFLLRQFELKSPIDPIAYLLSNFAKETKQEFIFFVEPSVH